MRIDVVTLFPEMFFGPLQESILKRAQERGLLSVVLHQLRDYALDRHQMTDDAPYGGGAGMVMKPEPIFHAVRSIVGESHDHAEDVPVILMTPQGRRFTQEMAMAWAERPRLLFLCGHYEGVDERVREHVVTDEVSIGDYVLTGGELAAMVVIDAVARFVPGVLGAAESAACDSHASGLLEGPHYTRPANFEGHEVPPILLSGDHAAIARWRRKSALRRTWERRPDLLAAASLSSRLSLSEEDRAFMDQLTQSGEIESELGEPDA
ncbi:MAG: tRNA (guanosine(37)-N1)-methyltransferase TrmD [Anaerolineales bacterium]